MPQRPAALHHHRMCQVFRVRGGNPRAGNLSTWAKF